MLANLQPSNAAYSDDVDVSLDVQNLHCQILLKKAKISVSPFCSVYASQGVIAVCTLDDDSANGDR